MMVLLRVTLLLLATHTSYINMAVTGMDATILDCISDLLNPDECHELYIRIAVSQKDAKQTLEEKDLSPSSQWQEISSIAQCKEALNHWLEMERGTVDWDRLAQVLRQIRHPDASKVLKNSLNKNRSLESNCTVEGNHKAEMVKSAPGIQNEARGHRRCNILVQIRKDSSRDVTTSFMLWFHWNNERIQCLLRAAGPIILVCCQFLWLVSVFYVIYWLLGECLFPKIVWYITSPAGKNTFLTMVSNYEPNEDFWEELEDDSSTSEYGETTENEF